MVWNLSFTLADKEDHKSVVSMYLPNATLQADAVAMAEDMAELIDNLTEALIERIALCLIVTLPAGLKSAALDASEVEIGARFGFVEAQGNRTHIRIPAFIAAKKVVGSKNVDLTDADVILFVDAINDGLTPVATLVQPTTNRGEDVTALTTAVENYTKARK